MADSKWKRRRIGRKKRKLQGKRSTEDDVELVQQTSPDKVLKPCSSFPSVVPVVIADLCSLHMPCLRLCATHEILLQHFNPRFCRKHPARFSGTEHIMWEVLSGVRDLTACTSCFAQGASETSDEEAEYVINDLSELILGEHGSLAAEAERCISSLGAADPIRLQHLCKAYPTVPPKVCLSLLLRTEGDWGQQLSFKHSCIQLVQSPFFRLDMTISSSQCSASSW